MKITIDGAGRLVIPKALRDAAWIRPGVALDARLRDGRIEIEPAPLAVELIEKQGVILACAKHGGAKRLATFDHRHFQRLRLDGIELVVP